MQCNGYINIYTALDRINDVIQRLPIVRKFKAGNVDCETTLDVVHQKMSEGLTMLGGWASEEFYELCRDTNAALSISVNIFPETRLVRLAFLFKYQDLLGNELRLSTYKVEDLPKVRRMASILEML